MHDPKNLKMPHYLIAYDVVQAHARTAISRKLEKIGKRIQQSVFIVHISQEMSSKLEQELQLNLDAKDSLLIVPLCESCFAKARIHCPMPPAMIFA